jgi:transcriptional regulator with XRE-family HTH domain
VTLSEWMKLRQLNDRQVAAAIAMSAAQVSRLRNGLREPSLKAMRAIFKLSAGRVTPNDWVAVGWRPSAAAPKGTAVASTDRVTADD